jgi:hypothetical protein
MKFRFIDDEERKELVNIKELLEIHNIKIDKEEQRLEKNSSY